MTTLAPPADDLALLRQAKHAAIDTLLALVQTRTDAGTPTREARLAASRILTLVAIEERRLANAPPPQSEARAGGTAPTGAPAPSPGSKAMAEPRDRPPALSRPSVATPQPTPLPTLLTMVSADLLGAPPRGANSALLRRVGAPGP